VHRKDLTRMLLPRLHRELGEVEIEELDGTITAGGEELVLIGLGPRDVEERVLGVEPGERALSGCVHTYCACDDGEESAPFLGHNTVQRQAQYVHPSISNKAKVGRCRDGNAGVEEWRVFDTVAVVALRAVFEHRAAGDLLKGPANFHAREKSTGKGYGARKDIQAVRTIVRWCCGVGVVDGSSQCLIMNPALAEALAFDHVYPRQRDSYLVAHF
jgi:hypothetical protein